MPPPANAVSAARAALLADEEDAPLPPPAALPKRPREAQDPAAAGGEDDDDFTEYVPVKLRRQQEAAQRSRRLGLAADGDAPPDAPAAAHAHEGPAARAPPLVLFAPPPASAAPPAQSSPHPAPFPPRFAPAAPPRQERTSLLVKAAELKKDRPAEEDPAAKMQREEAEILRNITDKKALVSAKELAQGTVYTTALDTGWRPPAALRAMSREECDEARSSSAPPRSAA